jgi:hypothetical protein
VTGGVGQASGPEELAATPQAARGTRERMTGAPRIDFVALKKYRVDAVDWSADHLPARNARLEEIHCLPLVEKLPRKHAREGDDLEGLDRPA